MVAGRPWPSSPRSGSGTLQDRIDVDEIILDRRLHIVLGHMALGTEVSAWRNRREELALAVGEVRDADHRRLRFAHAGARVTGQALVAVNADLVAFDRMRNERRLLGIVSGLMYRGV